MISKKYSSYDDYISEIAYDYPNIAFDYYKNKSGKTFLISSSDYYNRLRDEAESFPIEVKTLLLNKNHNIEEVAKITGWFYYKKSVAELGSIAINNKDFSHIGIGSHMLQIFEQSALNNGLKHISGIFCPYKPHIATYDEVQQFYLKNGYGFCSFPEVDSTTYLYKNYDFFSQPILPNDDEYPLTDNYKLTLYPFISNAQYKDLEDREFYE